MDFNSSMYFLNKPFASSSYSFESLSNQTDAFFGEYIVSPLAAILFWPIPGINMPLVWRGYLECSIFTLKLRFVNVRLFSHAINLVRGKYDRKDGVGEVTHFQALTTALSATVGLGNIAGVCEICYWYGRSWCYFWMILVGFLGMSSKFTECTLGQVSKGKKRWKNNGRSNALP